MDKGVKLSAKQRELVEKLGIINEKSGLQPAAARIMALLVISDKTTLSFEEIMDTLNLSKGATSMATNLLLSLKKLEYITISGDRKRYFRVKLEDWQSEVIAGIEDLSNISIIYKEILANRTKSTVEFNNELKDIISFLEFLHKEIPALYKKWKSKN